MKRIIDLSVSLILCVTILLCLGGCGSKKKVTAETLTGLLDTPYTVGMTELKEGVETVNIAGNIDESKLKNLAQAIYEKSKGQDVSEIDINVFKDSNMAKAKFTDFYSKDLANKVIVNTKYKTIYVYAYQDIKDVVADLGATKSWAINKVENNNGVLDVETDLDLSGGTEKGVAQVKALKEQLLKLNPQKKITNCEFYINPTGTTSYKYNDKYVNIICEITKFPLS